MASSSVEEVELGFTERLKILKNYLAYIFQVGSVVNLPGSGPGWILIYQYQMSLSVRCGKSQIFLLQLYAPIDHLRHCYHCTLYVFCCREPSCHSRNFTELFLVLGFCSWFANFCRQIIPGILLCLSVAMMGLSYLSYDLHPLASRLA